MKGLQEALRDREERHSRVDKHGISEEDADANSRTMLRLQRGMKVEISYYKAFHDVVRTGTVTYLNTAFRRLKLDDEPILFDDIYTIKILDL
ncbi:MAG: hypothetical protein J5854_02385 [Clostridia bacterium]|nr:hypothetical protein [Clostridia bacterium]